MSSAAYAFDSNPSTAKVKWNANPSRAHEQIFATDPNAFQLPNMDANRAAAGNMLLDANTRGIYNYNLDPRMQQQSRARQMTLADMMMDRAQGYGSVAEAQARMMGDRTAAQAMGLAAANRGNNPGMALRQALNAGSQAQLQANEIATQARLAEMAQAQQAAAGMLGQARGQDLATAQANAQLGLSGYLGQQGLIQQQQQASLGALMGLDATQLNANIAQQQIDAQAFMNQQNLAGQRGLVNLQGQWGLAGGGASGAGAGIAMAAMSDERLKTDIKDAGKKLDDFLSEVGAHEYVYKDKKFGEGRYVSPMAQELERTELGKSMVVNTRDGKMVDYGRGLGTILAAQARLHKRLDALESGRAA